MVASVYKWLALSIILPVLQFNTIKDSGTAPAIPGSERAAHPYYISVVELNHNLADKTLEISVKIFTSDFETTLEKNYGSKTDLVHPKDKAAAERMINDYIKKHLAFKTDGKPANFSFLGFEKEDEAIYSYFQVDNIPSVKRIDVTDSILHDFSDQQINIVHCTVGGKRQSTKLDYPKTEVGFVF
jgi:hypothetical protein